MAANVEYGQLPQKYRWLETPDAVWSSDGRQMSIEACDACHKPWASCQCPDENRQKLSFVVYDRETGVNEQRVEMLFARELPLGPAPQPFIPDSGVFDRQFKRYVEFINALFVPDEIVCFALIGQTGVRHDFVSVSRAISREYFDGLQVSNEQFNVFIGMNAYKAELTGQHVGREKKNVVAVKRLYADADNDGRSVLSKIQSSTIVPAPNVILESSPGKYQFIWNVGGLTQDVAEGLLKAIAQEFHTDPAVAEIARVLRVPGFKNLKYPERPEVKVIGEIDNCSYDVVDFQLQSKMDVQAPSKPEPPRDTAGLIPHGYLHNWLAAKAGKLRHQGLELDTLEPALIQLAEKNCAAPLDLDKVRQIARSICNYPVGENTELILTQAASSSTPIVPVTMPEPVERFAISQEETDGKIENEDYPVIPLVEQAGPAWSDDIMHGICGDIVRKASKYCESHPAGMYLDLLVGLGSIIGRKPFFNVNKTKHFTNEFLARVGATSDARKGTARDIVDEILKLVDVRWYDNRIVNGFGSAEAIINEIRDSRQSRVRDKKSPTGFSLILVPGVDDKRLCVREGELASVFQLVAKKDSRASIVLRDGWDSKPLKNIVKGTTEGLSNSASCDMPHISISGDTTASELRKKMPDGSDENGFGNRFLYCYVYRTKLCPNGGPEIDWTDEIIKLHRRVQYATELGCVGLTKPASKAWGRMYAQLEEPGYKLVGVSGAMTARAAAHIRRLALILALMDEYDVVETRHLHAAKAIWDYCQESAKFIFTGTTKDQDRILGWIGKQTRLVTDSEVADGAFHWHKKIESVKSQIEGLIQTGRVVKLDDKYKLPFQNF